MSKRVSFLALFEKRVNKIAGIVGGIVIIVGAAAALCSWVSSQFADTVSDQISDFREETQRNDKRHEQAVTRVELVILMEHDPDNVVAIEKMARYYFKALDGDLYMTQKYSEWCAQYGGDPTIVIGDK